MDPVGRLEELRAHEAEVGGCTRCSLAEGRARVVVGGGPVEARVMVVGEAPGFHEERGAGPFAGEAGALLAELLGRAGLRAEDVYVTTVLKCRPPASRDPEDAELAACEPHLFRQLELVRPEVVLSLGTIATRVLSGRPHPITAVHGRPQELVLGGLRTTLLPLYHPAAALYTPRMRATLEEDVACLGALLDADVAPATVAAEPGTAERAPAAPARPPEPVPTASAAAVAVGGDPSDAHGQLGLF